MKDHQLVPPGPRDSVPRQEALKNQVILVVEDNVDDVKHTLRAFARNNVGNPVVVARDGTEALNYLFGEGIFAGRDTTVQPGLILLDLKLPRVSGLEVLRALRGFERTRHVPVVVLTSSTEQQDLTRSYTLGANVYVRKPVQFKEFLSAARHLGVYWSLVESGLSLLHGSREQPGEGPRSVPTPPLPDLPPQRPVDPSALRVLLGTADTEMRRIVGDTLGNENYAVLHANDARGAFRVLLSDRPDVVILDVHLADISGIEVARAVRSSPRADEVPTILLARDVAGTALAIADDGVRVLGKPLDVLALTDLIREHVDARRVRELAAEAPRVAAPAAAPRVAAPPSAPIAPTRAVPPTSRTPSSSTWALLGVPEGAVAAEVVRAADALILTLAQRAQAARSQDERSSVSANAARIRAARTELLEFLLAPAARPPADQPRR